jgi:hypothetical protein
MSGSAKPEKPARRNRKSHFEIPEKFRHIDIDAPHPLLEMLPEDSGWMDVIERQQAATPEQQEEAEFVSDMRFLRTKKRQQRARRKVSRLVKQLINLLSDIDALGLWADDLAELAAGASRDNAGLSSPSFASAPILFDEEAVIGTITSEGSGDSATHCCANRSSFLRLLRFYELYEGGRLGELSATELRKTIVLMDAFEMGLLPADEFEFAINTIWRYTQVCYINSVHDLMHSAREVPLGYRKDFRATRDDIDHPSDDLGRPPISAEEREDFLRFLSSRYGVLWTTWNHKSRRPTGG